MIEKTQAIRSKHIRAAAKGQPCTVQIVGVCNGDPMTSVLAHLPDESHGMARKSDDISAVIACATCHDCIDRRARSAELEAMRDWYLRRALVRTWRVLVGKGVVQIKGAA